MKIVVGAMLFFSSISLSVDTSGLAAMAPVDNYFPANTMTCKTMRGWASVKARNGFSYMVGIISGINLALPETCDLLGTNRTETMQAIWDEISNLCGKKENQLMHANEIVLIAIEKLDLIENRVKKCSDMPSVRATTKGFMIE